MDILSQWVAGGGGGGTPKSFVKMLPVYNQVIHSNWLVDQTVWLKSCNLLQRYLLPPPPPTLWDVESH